jgi:hypothetical protein
VTAVTVRLGRGSEGSSLQASALEGVLNGSRSLHAGGLLGLQGVTPVIMHHPDALPQVIRALGQRCPLESCSARLRTRNRKGLRDAAIAFTIGHYAAAYPPGGTQITPSVV